MFKKKLAKMVIAYPGMWIFGLLIILQKRIDLKKFNSLVHSKELQDLFALRLNIPGHIVTTDYRCVRNYHFLNM